MDKPRVLHLYGQQHEHDEAYLVGNRAGLLALHAAIEAVLRADAPDLVTTAEAMTNDGEGFTVVVVREDADWQDPAWRTVAVPYTADSARETRATVVWPWQRVRKQI